VTGRKGRFLWHASTAAPAPPCPLIGTTTLPLLAVWRPLWMDVMALIGALHDAEHPTLPEIHRHLRARGVRRAERTVTYLSTAL
jgi:hypothetical protein